MGYYVGLDVSLKTTHICVLRADRSVVWQGLVDTRVGMIADAVERWRGELDGMRRDGSLEGILQRWLPAARGR